MNLITPIGGDVYSEESFTPIEGLVPDSTTAEKIAEIIFVRFYGLEKISAEKPFTTKLEDDVWAVEGYMPPGTLGGVAEIRISKKDGRILHLSHGQ